MPPVEVAHPAEIQEKAKIAERVRRVFAEKFNAFFLARLVQLEKTNGLGERNGAQTSHTRTGILQGLMGIPLVERAALSFEMWSAQGAYKGLNAPVRDKVSRLASQFTRMVLQSPSVESFVAGLSSQVTNQRELHFSQNDIVPQPRMGGLEDHVNWSASELAQIYRLAAEAAIAQVAPRQLVKTVASPGALKFVPQRW